MRGVNMTLALALNSRVVNDPSLKSTQLIETFGSIVSLELRSMRPV
jgi:hypothetical protein